MPIDLARVERVDALPTVNPDVQQFTITAITIEEIPRTTTYTTVNPFRASLCQAAAESRIALWLTWRDIRWGKQLMNVEADHSSWSFHV